MSNRKEKSLIYAHILNKSVISKLNNKVSQYGLCNKFTVRGIKSLYGGNWNIKQVFNLLKDIHFLESPHGQEVLSDLERKMELIAKFINGDYIDSRELVVLLPSYFKYLTPKMDVLDCESLGKFKILKDIKESHVKKVRGTHAERG